jgi:hypothetical protein
MELNHDWRGYRTLFQSRARPGAKPPLSDSVLGAGPIRMVVEGNVILAVGSGEGEDFFEWTGQTVESFITAFPHRDLLLIDRKEADAKLAGSLGLSHSHDQALFLREQTVVQYVACQSQGKAPSKLSLSHSRATAKGNARSALPMPASSEHFLLSGLQSWWAKVLPSAYGFFIRLEPAVSGSPNLPMTPSEGSEVFVLVRRGRLELFHSPDLSGLGGGRARQPAVVVKYLSEKHGVPVQGLIVSASDWNEWSGIGLAASGRPGDYREAWRRLSMAIQANEAQLVPFRWQVMTLAATRAFLGF